MPYDRKRNKKKTYRRRSRKTYKRRSVYRPQRILSTGFPKTTAVKLRYVDSITMNASAGTVDSHVFVANSLFDPDLVLGGHQPLGFDQWSQFYNHYVVVGSKIKASFSSQTSSPATNGFYLHGITLSDDPTFTANPLHLMEQPLTRVVKQSVHTNAQRIKSVTRTYSAKKFFNITNVTDNITRIGAPITANPTEQAYFIVYTGNSDVLADSEPVTVLIEIEFITIFSEPKELIQS